MASWSWSAEKSVAPVERELFGASGLPSDAHPLLPFFIEHIVRLGADSLLESELFDHLLALESRSEIEGVLRQVSKLPFRALNSDCSDTHTDHLKLKISKQEIIATRAPLYCPVTIDFEIKPTHKKSVLVRQWGQQGPLNEVFSFVSRYLLTLQGKSVDLWNMVVFLQPNSRFRKIHLLEVGENPSIFYPILIDISEEHYHPDTEGRTSLTSSGGSSSLRSSSGSSSSPSSTHKKKKEVKLGKLPGSDAKRVARAYAWPVAQSEFSTTSPIEALGDHAVVALYGTLVICQYWHDTKQAGARHWTASYWKTMDWLNDHRHPKLAPRIASSPEDSKPYIIFDAPHTIDELLSSLPASHREFSRICQILMDVAEALAYLHNVGKAHGRISPWAVCHSTDLGTLLIDYATFDRSPPDFIDLSLSNPVQPTDAYLAPESIGASEFTTAADIFALGILIWRLFNDKPPRFTVGEIKSGTIPPSSDTNDFESSGMSSLFELCTNRDPSARPTAVECWNRLRSILNTQGSLPLPKTVPIVRRRLTSTIEH
jgi:hypothetical protein